MTGGNVHGAQDGYTVREEDESDEELLSSHKELLTQFGFN